MPTFKYAFAKKAVSVVACCSIATSMVPMLTPSLARADESRPDTVYETAKLSTETDSAASSSVSTNKNNTIDSLLAQTGEEGSQSIISTSTVLNSVGSDASTQAILTHDGLNFCINEDNPSTLAFIGWSGAAPKGKVDIPEAVVFNEQKMLVTRIASQVSFEAELENMGIDEASLTDADCAHLKSELVASVATAPEVEEISIPATVCDIDTSAFAAYPNLRKFTVNAQNETYKSCNDMLFNADLTCLLAVPEGMEGAAVLPCESLVEVSSVTFARCSRLVSIDATGSTAQSAYTSQNGLLYTQDMETLVAAPAGLGASVTIAPECTHIADFAFYGNADLQTIIADGSVTTISENQPFPQTTIENATVVTPYRSAWEAAGFTHFAELPQLTDANATELTEEQNGFCYRMLGDYTLSVSWVGEEAPDAYLQIPSTGQVAGVAYVVSAIADGGFQNLSSIEQVSIPQSVTSVGNSAFAGCTNLKSCELPDGVQQIGNSAFEGTSLVSVILPEQLTHVGDAAFGGLKDTTIVSCSQSSTNAQNISPSALVGSTGVSVYVPYNKQEVYAWKPGLPAAGNHIYAYGAKLATSTFALEVGQSTNMFEGDGYLHAPGNVRVGCVYSGDAVSIDPRTGVISALRAGSGSCKVTLSLLVPQADETQKEVTLPLTV